LEKVFRILPATSEKLIEKIENVKLGLSKKLTGKEVKSPCQVQAELENLQVK